MRSEIVDPIDMPPGQSPSVFEAGCDGWDEDIVEIRCSRARHAGAEAENREVVSENTAVAGRPAEVAEEAEAEHAPVGFGDLARGEARKPESSLEQPRSDAVHAWRAPEDTSGTGSDWLAPSHAVSAEVGAAVERDSVGVIERSMSPEADARSMIGRDESVTRQRVVGAKVHDVTSA